MRLLSVARARAIWVMRFEDMNIQGRNLLPLFFATKERYGFLEHTKIEDIPHLGEKNMGLSFLRGTFLNSAQIPIAVDATVYSDSIFGESHSSTDDADAFLDDLLRWATREFGLSYHDDLVRRRIYLSELWVRTDKALNTINPALSAFVARYSAMVSKYTSHPISFETTGITFGHNRIIANPFGPFRFERAETGSFAENRYYSAANLTTSEHLEILNDLEKLLKG
jgi:hypothetical protein